MIIIKSKDEIEIMREAAVPTKEMLANLADMVKPGISTKDIDDYVEEYILKSGQKPAFKGYGGFPFAACVSVNEEIVHGFPSKKRILKEGDIVSVDLGTIYKGYYSDAARTYPVGKISELHEKLIKTCEESFFAGIAHARVGFRLGDISHAIQECVESAGFSVDTAVDGIDGATYGEVLEKSTGMTCWTYEKDETTYQEKVTFRGSGASINLKDNEEYKGKLYTSCSVKFEFDITGKNVDILPYIDDQLMYIKDGQHVEKNKEIRKLILSQLYSGMTTNND